MVPTLTWPHCCINYYMPNQQKLRYCWYWQHEVLCSVSHCNPQVHAWNGFQPRSMVVYIPNNPYQHNITNGNPLPKSVFWHQISSIRWWHWQNSTLLCTSHTISIGSTCLFPWAFMPEMTQFPTSITLDLRPIFLLTTLWLEPIIPIYLLSRLSLSKTQFHWHRPLSQLLLAPRLVTTSWE